MANINPVKTSMKLINSPKSTKNIDDIDHETLEYSMLCANDGLTLCKEKYPLGGTNRKDVMDKYKDSDEFKNNVKNSNRYLEIMTQLKNNDTIDNDTKEQQTVLEDKLLKGGGCTVLAFLLRRVLWKKYKDITVEVVAIDNHHFVVINRNPASDPTDIRTWGNTAVICDYWANMAYPASEFMEKQRNCKDIPSYETPDNNDPTKLVLSNEHFLKGNPLVYYPLAYPISCGGTVDYYRGHKIFG